MVKYLKKMNTMHLCLFSILISVALSGNGIDVKNQLLLMPMPKQVTANYNSADSVIVTSALNFIVGTNCDEKCKEFLTDNFNHTITTSLKRQEGLDDFKVSLHEDIDIHLVKIRDERGFRRDKPGHLLVRMFGLNIMDDNALIEFREPAANAHGSDEVLHFRILDY